MSGERRSVPSSAVRSAERQGLVRLSKRLTVQRCARLLRRVARMSPSEVIHRGGGALLGPGGADRPASGMPCIDVNRACEELQRRFLFGAGHRDALVDWLREHAPGVARRVCDDAAGLRRTGIAVFGHQVALQGAVDWRADPRSAWRWPERALDEAAAVAATRFAPVLAGGWHVDVKDVWELNRHQFLPTLGCASWLDADAGHAAFAASLVESWIAQNPAGVGVNWASPLEVGLRAISWLWTLAFVLATPSVDGAPVDGALKDRWMGSLAQHYQILVRRLSTFTDRTNHLIGEAAALWMLSSVVPSLPDAARQRERALAILCVEVERQVTSDGVSREQSLGYHCFVLDFYLQVVALARRLGESVPVVIESRLTAMLAFLARMLGCGGAVPQIGDGDDGIALPFPGRVDGARQRAESLLAAGAQLFDRPGWYPDTTDCALLSYWLLGGTVGAAHLITAGRERRAAGLTVLDDGGYAIFEAATDDGRSRQLVFDVGGLGYLPNAAHEHADALSILIRVNRTLVLADPGTGTYTGSASVRDTFRGTNAHNTVTIDDLDQADMLDTFKWVNPVTTELVGSSSSAEFDHVAAEHDGYERLRRPIRHRRDVFFVRPDYWIVVDRLTGRGRHRVARRFHFPPDVQITMPEEHTFDVVSRRSSDGLRFIFPVEPAESSTTVRIEDAMWSARYGCWEPTPCVVAESVGEPPFILPTLIVPLDPDGAAMDVRLDRAEGGIPPELDRGGVLCRATATRGPTRYQDVCAAAPIGQGERANAGLRFVRRDAEGQVVSRFGDVIPVRGAGGV